MSSIQPEYTSMKVDNSLNTGHVPQFDCCGQRLDFRYMEGGDNYSQGGTWVERIWHYAYARCPKCHRHHQYGAGGGPDSYELARVMMHGYRAARWPGKVKKAPTAFWLILRHSFEHAWEVNRIEAGRPRGPSAMDS